MIQKTKSKNNEIQTRETKKIGMATPTQNDIAGGASRVESYQCENCGNYARFPRYNNRKF